MIYRAGTRATDGLLKIFNLISEEYLYAFLALDVVALWITRILKGLDRGKITYDPKTDPKAKDMGPWEQLKYTWRKNIQGLNWANAREEALREILTGPGALIMPTLVYAYARNKYKGSAMQLGYPAMVEMKNTYIDHLSRSHLNGITGKISAKEYTRNLSDFVVNLFDDPHGLHRKDPKYRELQEMLKHRIEIAHPATGQTSRVTVREYIRSWADEWAKKATEPITKPPKIDGKSFDEMAKELKEALIHKYNRQVMPNGAAHSGEVLVRTLQESGKGGKPTSKIQLRSLDEVLNNLKYFKDYANTVYETHTKTPNSKIAEVAEYGYRRLTRNKFVFAIIATLVASLYLFTLPRLVQKEGHYPANRLYQEGEENAGKDQAPPKKTQPSAPQPTRPVNPPVRVPFQPGGPPPVIPTRFSPQPQPFIPPYPAPRPPLTYPPYGAQYSQYGGTSPW